MQQKAVFYDELGNEIEFLVKAKFSIDDVDYVVLLPSGDIDSPTYILKIDLDENGNEILVGIDDEELEEAKEVYEELMKEQLQ
ncbi:DUF1292 domain-containing protein [Vibrio parahaemolyticus]|nr:DUF1292 domain-containing protein [Tissierellales bacterium]MDF5581175.1 DUF1292 domain-containing protein [Vibrio parahaemolyticus]